jgi:glycine cleavage system transcriptional repressor
MAETKSYAVLTAVGTDRPGIVSEISSLMRDVAANIEDSRMAILGGEFALILLFSGAPAAHERVRAEIGKLEQKTGLAVSLRATSGPTPAPGHLPYRLRVSGEDRPGIVFSIAEVLAGRNVNVASLESELRHAPHTGTPMFVLTAALQVPSAVALPALRAALAAKCDLENLDHTLESG